MLSPGIQIKEIDLSVIVPTVSKSVAAFAGDFEKGPVGKFLTVSNVKELENLYGEVTEKNYNDWFQVFNLLQYSNKLLLSRACNTEGTKVETANAVKSATDNKVTIDGAVDSEIIVSNFVLPSKDAPVSEQGIVLEIDTDSDGNSVLVFPVGYDTSDYAAGNLVTRLDKSLSSIGVVVTEGSDDLTADELKIEREQILSDEDFEIKESSIPLSATEKIKFFGKTLGESYNGVKIGVAQAKDFESGKSEIFEGIVVNTIFDRVPNAAKNEIAIAVENNGKIVEKFIVSLDSDAKDFRNKTIFIDEVIARKSQYIYSKTNTSVTDAPQSRLYKIVDSQGNVTTDKLPIVLSYGIEIDVKNSDIEEAFGSVANNTIYGNKDEIDIDILIANERTRSYCAQLAKDRADCIAFIGASLEEVVGMSSGVAVENLVATVKSGDLAGQRHSFAAFFGNYKYQYDKFRDKNIWVSVAGDVAGLRADTSTKKDIWWASAGLERGQIKNCIKLAFNPSSAQRDLLYKNGINPIVSFPGQGNGLVWGQKTLTGVASAFDRINVRGLFNSLERSISRMAKSMLFEFNDEFSRNRFLSIVEPYLEEIKAGRGIYDFAVVCDETNNTADVVDRNEFVAQIAVKPTRTAEFITLEFMAVASSVDFNEIFS